MPRNTEPSAKVYQSANEGDIRNGGFTPPAAIGRPPLPDQQRRVTPAEQLGDAARAIGSGGGQVEER